MLGCDGLPHCPSVFTAPLIHGPAVENTASKQSDRRSSVVRSRGLCKGSPLSDYRCLVDPFFLPNEDSSVIVQMWGSSRKQLLELSGQVAQYGTKKALFGSVESAEMAQPSLDTPIEASDHDKWVGCKELSGLVASLNPP